MTHNSFFAADGYEPSSSIFLLKDYFMGQYTSLNYEAYVVDGNLECLKELVKMTGTILSLEGEYSLICIAASKGHLNCLKYLVEKELPFDYSLARQFTIENGHTHCTEYLDDIKNMILFTNQNDEEISE